MSKEDYVSLEVAKMLKEKGFDEYCGAYYHLYWMNEYTEDESFEISSSNDFKNSNNVYRIGAPTLYEAQKWLREKHNIHLVVQCICYHGPTHHYDYKCEIYALDSNRGYREADIRCTYEETLNLGILEALKLI